MNASEKLIYQYEIARQSVATLKRERVELIGKCDKLSTITTKDEFGFVNIEDRGTLCLVSVWSDFKPDEWDADYQMASDQTDYAEVLHEVGCDSCIESYRIKRGPLAIARQEFGIVKRRLSSMGKKLSKVKG